jgi:micrococcal nuclease
MWTSRSKLVAALCLAAVTLSVSARQEAQWQGMVVRITDGDTLWVRPQNPAHADPAPQKIRLEGIDAPESCQTYGRQSMLALKQLIDQKMVTVIPRRRDDYGREVAKITLNKTDVGAWMVSHGHAWSYHYRHRAGPYAAQELTAQSARLGLFATSTPVQPGVFRKTHGSCYTASGAQRHTPRN